MALTIQERLKDLRVECGLTLGQLAEQTHLSKSALGSYEAEDFKDISHYTLSSGETQTESVAQTGTVSTGMGNMGGSGGQKPDGAPPSGGCSCCFFFRCRVSSFFARRRPRAVVSSMVSPPYSSACPC